MKLTCLVMPLFTLCIGCSGVANNYMAVHKAGLQSIAYANEMERVFGQDTDHFISTPDGGGFIWRSKAYVDDQCFLTMSVDVKVDTKTATVTVMGPYTFMVNHVRQVEVLKNGQVQTSFDGQVSFDE